MKDQFLMSEPLEEVEDPHKPLYTIREASQMSGVGANLIRAYERMGLIRPYRDPKNNYRLFTYDEVRWISRIKRLINEVGLNIEGIKCVLTITPCWETRNCPEEVRENCPAYKEKNYPCWFSKDGVYCCSVLECYRCPHYINARNHRKLII